MNTVEWIAEVDRLRESDELLQRGAWHGYTDREGGAAPMRGTYYLVRWARPTVAVSSDSTNEVLAAARAIESALAGARREQSA